MIDLSIYIYIPIFIFWNLNLFESILFSNFRKSLRDLIVGSNIPCKVDFQCAFSHLFALNPTKTNNPYHNQMRHREQSVQSKIEPAEEDN